MKNNAKPGFTNTNSILPTTRERNYIYRISYWRPSTLRTLTHSQFLKINKYTIPWHFLERLPVLWI